MSMKTVGVAALTALTILGGTLVASAPASARGGGGFHGGGGGFHGGGGFRGGGFGGRGFGGRGLGLGVGIATGLALGGYGYGYGGYGYPAYAYDDGSYGGDCYVQRRVAYRYGHRVLVPVQVCG